MYLTHFEELWLEATIWTDFVPRLDRALAPECDCVLECSCCGLEILPDDDAGVDTEAGTAYHNSCPIVIRPQPVTE